MLSWQKALGVTVGAAALALLATPAAHAAEIDKTTCEAQSAFTGTVFTQGPAVACWSLQFDGAFCVLYTHEDDGTTESWKCYVPLPI